MTKTRIALLVSILLTLTACIPAKVGIVSELPPTPVIIQVVITNTPAPTATPPDKPFRYTAQYYTTGNGDGQTGFSLPPYGTLCVDTEVKGNPREWAQSMYILPAGTVVELREQPETEPRDWVMIETARWIPLSALCE